MVQVYSRIQSKKTAAKKKKDHIRIYFYFNCFAFAHTLQILYKKYEQMVKNYGYEDLIFC
jgi:hypothetical protein